ncbi:DUF4199 domain-containing protein [Marinilongibacter aquaticus]|uniref:DUF4199 domain-containing protein n=1 Tax=Marinilongibacter aquaticus TaxID=2975157 RepID=UPI0021BD4019|nr:DUF4199 domain-containing protein [Marinilongibacter aquaticus]UBM59820.1 DUF4199 domain-containing protein [Marinilongibacter aquaticus]
MRKKIINISLIFGLVSGLACFLFFIMLYMGNDNPLQQRRPDVGINILFIFLAVFLYKRRQGGYLHFYEGFSIGFLTNLIAALTTGTLIYGFVKWIDPAPFQNWIRDGKQFLIDQKEALSNVLNEESFKLQMQAFDNAKPYQIILDDLMFKQFAIIAIMLIAMALRRQSPQS